MKTITIKNIPGRMQLICGIQPHAAAPKKINFKDLIAMSRVQTLGSNEKGEIVPKFTYNLSVRKEDNKQFVLRTDEHWFEMLEIALSDKIINQRTIDYATIKIEKWFFNDDPHVV